MTVLGTAAAALGGVGAFYAAFGGLMACDPRRPGVAACLALLANGAYWLLIWRLFY